MRCSLITTQVIAKQDNWYVKIRHELPRSVPSSSNCRVIGNLWDTIINIESRYCLGQWVINLYCNLFFRIFCHVLTRVSE